ncbi:MAG: DNA-directed RNA polymerase subunit alpha C-terminal domain-containing protein [Oscillospiraceae bacterium]|nr:DNA-directed RNA polymerase subunit alpha C-terminal domain-containing protein [Oscillospiraceae bacterium]
MIHETTANNLYEKAKSNGLINTLYSAFGNNINTSIAFSQSACDAGIDSIEFSVRASNALKRSGLLTIGSVIDAIMNDELLRVRNLGRKSYNEIKTKILLYGYKRLTEREKIAFFYYLVSNNTLIN